jgi:hypothetical protein
MDTGALIAEVAKRHQVLLDPNDPVVVMATAAELAMEPPVEKMEAIAARCEAAAARCETLVQHIGAAIPGMTREVGNRFIDHHRQYLSAANWRTGTFIAGGVLMLCAVSAYGGWWLFEQQNGAALSWGRAAMEACSSVPVVDGACHATIKLR